MRSNKLFPGIILIFIGLAFLLHSMHILHFHWSNFAHLWPLFIIIAGINLLLGHKREPWALLVRVAVVVGCFGILLFGNFNYPENSRWFHFNYHHHHNDRDDDEDADSSDDDDDNDNGKSGRAAVSNVYNEPWKANTKIATLNISGGGVHYVLSDTTSALVTAKTKERFGRFILTNRTTDSSNVVDFNLKADHVSIMGLPDKSNDAELKLNSSPVWDVNIDGGANELNFDLSRFRIRRVELNGGATDCTLKMGMPLAATHVDISTGASSITIDVPNGAACDITTNTGLSSNNIDGFNNISSNHYQTANFNAAANKLYIYLNGGISDFKVHKY